MHGSMLSDCQRLTAILAGFPPAPLNASVAAFIKRGVHELQRGGLQGQACPP